MLSALDLPEPPPALVEATQSADPEVRKRAAQAIEAIRARPTARGRAFASKGQIDLFVASTRAWELPPEDERLWQPAFDLANVLAKKSKFGWWPPLDHRRQFGSLAEFRKEPFQRFLRSDQPHEQEKAFPSGQSMGHYPGGIMAPGVSSPVALSSNIIVSRGDTRANTCLATSMVFANGNVVVGTHLSDAIIVCDGDVTVEDRILETLIVARGNIHAKAFATGSALVAGGTIKLDKPRPAGAALANSLLKENDPNAFGFVTFFELSTVGLEVKVAEKAVTVAAVAEGKAFAKAGVKVGDVLAEVNGKKPDSAESLRRLLRDALAIGDATVTLKRNDKTETVKVSLPE